jgi:hypothetical protein
MDRTVEGLISTVCTRYEHVNFPDIMPPGVVKVS